MWVVTFLSRSRSVPWLRITSYVTLRCLGWVALTWLVFLLIDRQPARRMNARDATFKVAPMVLAATLFDLLVKAAIVALTQPWAPATFADTFVSLIPTDFHESLIWIFVISAVGHGIRFHYMQAESRVRASRMKAALAQAQMQALSSRIQPHFLFNALNGVSAMLHRDPRAAQRMISRLGDLLRASMTSDEPELIPVGRELAYAADYLEIQQIRFADRMRVSISASEEAEPLLVPRFLLQPLVENAVKHGIEPMHDGGEVAVTACVGDGHLLLTVRNDVAPDLPSNGTRGGLGLHHTRARLELLYGRDEGALVCRRRGGQMETIVSIPLRQ